MESMANSLNQKKMFPWGIELCTLKHPKTGRGLKGILPTESGGVIILYDESSSDDLGSLIEYSALKMLDELDVKIIDLHVIDFSIKNRFPNLSSLKVHRLYNIYHTNQAGLDFLKKIESKIIYRHHNLLNGNFNTISESNEKSDFPEIYSLMIINVDDLAGEEWLGGLERIIGNCFAAGIYIIFFKKNNVSSENKKGKDLFNGLKGNYPRVSFENSEFKRKIIFNSSSVHARKLLDICHKFSLDMKYPVDIDIEISSLVKKFHGRAKNNENGLKNFLSVPIGTTVNGRQEITYDLGQKSGNFHSLILGGTGTGKTTLLNNIIVKIAEKYTSSEIRLYLMDYKNGTEFQQFKNHPNCEKIFLDNSDFQAAKSLIVQFSNLITERAPLFREAMVANIDDYNKINPNNKLYRVILIVDEIQKLFSSPEGTQLQKHLKVVAEQGRSFGVHFIFSTQSLSDYTLEPSLMEQMTLRAALPISPRDCTRLFGYNNSEASKLKNFHVLINNDRSGSVDSNVICRCYPPVDLSVIDNVINELNPELVLKPVICRSQDSIVESEVQNTYEEPIKVAMEGLDMEGLESLAKKEEEGYLGG